MASTGVVIASCKAHADTWLRDCLDSVGHLNPVVAMNTPERNEFDAAALRVGCETFDEFWMMPDTCVVHDVDAIRTLLEWQGESFSLGPGYISCIGKIVTADAKRVGLPEWPRTKRQAVEVELGWMRRYAFATGARVLCPTFTDGDEFEERHGRRNMVLRSPILTKYKGTWSMDMVPD